MSNSVEKKYWERVRKYLPVLRFVPGIRMVAVCNNLAFGKVSEHSDIDLFIVAKEGRLFVVRTFVTAILHLLGVRRHGDKVAGRFCLSFFVDDSALDLRGIALENDVYLKIWMMTMKPVVDDGVFEKFLMVNEVRNDFTGKVFKPFRFFSFASGGISNKLFAFFQLRMIENKRRKLADHSGIVANMHMLKFHNIDRRKKYQYLWKDKYGDEEVSLEKFLTIL
ncbi:hypothetical protein KJ632_03405 [Patescibacteria group bacterium]|nr:hypothetical protein [Patescibacteria group bacterium]